MNSTIRPLFGFTITTTFVGLVAVLTACTADHPEAQIGCVADPSEIGCKPWHPDAAPTDAAQGDGAAGSNDGGNERDGAVDAATGTDGDTAQDARVTTDAASDGLGD